MRTIRIIVFAAGVVGALFAGQPLTTAGPQAGKAKLWAGVSAQMSFFNWDRANNSKPQLDFALVNDSDQVIDPELESSQLVVNGKDYAGWTKVIMNGPREDRWKALPSKGRLSFTRLMANVFTEPGVYRVSWKGKDFQSAETVFRVMSPARVERGRSARSAGPADLPKLDTPPQAEPGKLWAGITVPQPLFILGGGGRPPAMVHFALLNDKDQAVNPEIMSWRLVVNGREYADSQMMFLNGPGDSRRDGLPAKDFLRFAKGTTNLFTEPGLYKVSWHGKDFQSPEIEFQVVAPDRE